MASDPTTPPPARERLASIDAYRGFVMLAMASAGLGASHLVETRPDDQFWAIVYHHTEHVIWRGCSAWDLIQPSFMFLVGAAAAFSYAARRAGGQPWREMLGHALVRSAALVALAIFLSSAWSNRTNYVFTNVLAQIGLGYPIVFLCLGLRPRGQLLATAGILVLAWALFAAYPRADPESLLRMGGVIGVITNLDGFFDHWSMHVNAGAAFDRWFLNLFPQASGELFEHNDGGYTTLNFLPSIATMLSGVLAGELLRTGISGWSKVKALLVTGALAVAMGSMLDGSICPIVKRLWTPAWVLYSTGWTLWTLAAFYAVIDVSGWRRWAFPLVVVGTNSIAMYVMAQLMKPFVRDTIRTHLGRKLFEGDFGPMRLEALMLACLWLVCYAMYRRKIFIRL
jgi:predicted acyltransferase